MSIERYETYKTFAGFKYHLNFPDEWILDEITHTGRECWNCVGRPGECDGFAMWRGIILGYCGNCAPDYDGERGKGFIGLGVEYDGTSFESAFDLYLGPIDFETYGDLADNEKDTVENRQRCIEEQDEDDGMEDEYWGEEEDGMEDEYWGEEEDGMEDEYWGEEEDDFGECLHIGCGKASVSGIAYCDHHSKMYDK
jgi:hypothetical protein